MKEKTSKQTQQKDREKYIEELILEVEEDYKNRQKERVLLERQWELNINFLRGNQYCDLSKRGEITTADKDFFWQKRSVFNHIAPIVESRLAKFSRVSPTVSVRPKTDDDKDVAGAMLAEKIISNAFKSADTEGVVKRVTEWSETCGTGFYKVVWDNDGGAKIGVMDGEPVYDGSVKIIEVSPFEIFPDCLFNGDIDDCASIIHAKAVSVSYVKERYGVSVLGEKIGIYDLSTQKMRAIANNQEKVINDAVVVIERYEKPNKEYPNGRLVTVAGGKLLYVGELPYINGDNGVRKFPFIKQVSLNVAGNFFGSSIIERLIPVQRAFNAVKNRKHEFLNRLSMGLLTVEDGSVDVDDLAEEGLSPGKVLVYRQGSKAPEMMTEMTMPDDFSKEEEKLLNEFVTISGVSDVSSSSTNASLTSGSALEILVEQDNSRLISTAENIRRCYLEIAKQVIRLYGQFTVGLRTVKDSEKGNKTKIYYADENAVNSDDVYLEDENELLSTYSQKKDMIFKLYQSGLLTDEEGKLRASTKEKILGLLGYKELDYQKGVAKLQEEKAQKENERILKEIVEVEIIDDHVIHVDEHTRFILSEYDRMSQSERQRCFDHVKQHKDQMLEKQQNNKGE